MPGGGWRRGEEIHELRLYDFDELLEMLDLAGFDARVLDGEESYASAIPGLVAIAARRPG
jgi:hypothetical protein